MNGCALVQQPFPGEIVALSIVKLCTGKLSLLTAAASPPPPFRLLNYNILGVAFKFKQNNHKSLRAYCVIIASSKTAFAVLPVEEDWWTSTYELFTGGIGIVLGVCVD